MKIKNVTTTSVEIPYDAPVGPYVGRGGRKSVNGRGLIVKIETDSGLVGWGEGDRAFETDPNAILAGHEVADIEGVYTVLEEAGVARGPTSGVEMALWDLLGKKAEMPLHQLWGGMVRSEVDFCGCQGIKAPAESAASARAYVDRWGFRYIKTKAGDDSNQDLAIAEAIQKAIGDDAVLRPDANAGYDPDGVLGVMSRMKSLGVRHFEDPVSVDHVETLVRIRKDVGFHVLVNMGVGQSKTVTNLLANAAADTLMPDTTSCGGLLRVRKVAATAEAWGVQCLMHCSHDLGLKTAAVTHVAASTPNFSGPNDTCYHGLVDDVLVEKLKFDGGRIMVPTGPGLGVEVDEGKVEKYRV